MRALGLVFAAVLALSVSACGNDASDSEGPSADRPATASPATGDPTDGGDTGDSAEDATASTQADAERIAVRLEQIFAGSSYPKDLAGAVRAAQQNDLEPSSGNTIAGYEYDADDVEFKLCVENTSGAYAIYDTRPMSMRGAGDSGGCP